MRSAPLPGVGSELAHGAEEVPVLANLQRQARRLRHRLQRLQHPPLARCRHHQPLRAQAQQVCLQLRGQAAAVAGVVQVHVVHWPASLLQFEGEVAHRRKEQRRAWLAGNDVGGLLRHLGHPHRVLGGVEAVEGGRVQVELVAQHDHQLAQLSHGHYWLWRRGGRRRSSTSPPPSSAPSGGASSWAGRRRRRVWPAGRICCRGSRMLWKSSMTRKGNGSGSDRGMVGSRRRKTRFCRHPLEIHSHNPGQKRVIENRSAWDGRRMR
jgi:hypothetical protein